MRQSNFLNSRWRRGIGRLAGTASVTLVVLAAGVLSAPAQAESAAVNLKELRVGYQKYGTLIILKARGTLEKRLADKGVSVKWSEFPFGPPLLEAINVGSIDLGSVGESHRSSPRPPAPIWFMSATNRRRRRPRHCWCPRIRRSGRWPN